MKRSILSFLFLALLALAAVAARAESNAPNEPFTLTWDAIGSGGVSSGGPYTLADAAGQPAAGVSSGGSFTLADGFAAAGGAVVALPANKVYLPAILK
ncbi:MAG: hypothetical protein K1X65_13805 [Caldilineales bacterium]|nr:hypothetical protein [Caldilineales bacterium]